MILSERFPNFETGLLDLIGDKSPRLASNDSKLLSYMVPLRNFNKGFDYYELTPTQNGGVYISTVTMLGLKTIVKTNSEVYFHDLSPNEWFDLVFKTATLHFSKEEYVALKKGYVKKGPNGCMLMFSLIITSLGFAYVLL